MLSLIPSVHPGCCCAAAGAGVLQVRNHAGLTPLVLCAHLGKMDMFQHIYSRRRRAFYSFGRVSYDSFCWRIKIFGVPRISSCSWHHICSMQSSAAGV
jgi:hypothetical protein